MDGRDFPITRLSLRRKERPLQLLLPGSCKEILESRNLPDRRTPPSKNPRGTICAAPVLLRCPWYRREHRKRNKRTRPPRSPSLATSSAWAPYCRGNRSLCSVLCYPVGCLGRLGPRLQCRTCDTAMNVCLWKMQHKLFGLQTLHKSCSIFHASPGIGLLFRSVSHCIRD